MLILSCTAKFFQSSKFFIVINVRIFMIFFFYGIRFCRTYFLKCGNVLPNIDNDDVLVSRPSEQEELLMVGNYYDIDDNKERMKNSKNIKLCESEMELNLILERLKSLYVKLWLSLRACVRTAFQSYTDVLEAGTFIQNTMDLIMRGKDDILLVGILDLGLGIYDDPHLRNIKLVGSERLQVGGEE